MQWKETLKTNGVVPGSRRGHTMTALNSSTLILFGGESDNDELLNDMHTFDITTATWHKVNYAPGPIPRPRYRHTTTAIHSTAIVVIGGEMRDGKTDKIREDSEPFGENQIDVWLFDLRSNLWIELTSNAKDPNVPFARAGHSSLFIKVPGQPPGIYLFGGLGASSFSSIVHRLRTSDWKWERVTVLTKTLSGMTVPTVDPIAYRHQELENIRTQKGIQPDDIPNGVAKQASLQEQLRPPIPCPSERESHVAVWVNSIQSMVIFGGEMDEKFHADFWAFSPLPGKANTWNWRLLRMNVAGNNSLNSVPALSAASGILIPSMQPQLLIWAGIKSSVSLNKLHNAWVVDLLDLKSYRIDVHGVAQNVGRLLHSLILSGSKLLLCGGVDADSDSDCSLQVIQLDSKLTGSHSSANDFGVEAARIALNGSSDSDGEDYQNIYRTNGEEKSPERLENKMQDPPDDPLLNSTFSGHVTLSSEHGTIVSIMINNQPYKGILVKCPTSTNDEEVSSEPEQHNLHTPVTCAKSGELKVPDEINDHMTDTTGKKTASVPPDIHPVIKKKVPTLSGPEPVPDVNKTEEITPSKKCALASGEKKTLINTTSVEPHSKSNQRGSTAPSSSAALSAATGIKRRLGPKLQLQEPLIETPTTAATLSNRTSQRSPSPLPVPKSPTPLPAHKTSEDDDEARAEKRRKYEIAVQSLKDADEIGTKTHPPFKDDDVIFLD